MNIASKIYGENIRRSNFCDTGVPELENKKSSTEKKNSKWPQTVNFVKDMGNASFLWMGTGWKGIYVLCEYSPKNIYHRGDSS